MSYIIVTDSSADLPGDYYSKNNLIMVPLTVTIDGMDFPDDGTVMNSKQFFDKLRAGKVAQTSQVSREQFKNAFTQQLQAGNDIIYLGLNSALSGTHDAACAVRKELMEQYPDRFIFVPQTTCVSLGLGLLVHQACKRRDAGMDFEQLCAWVEDKKLTFHHKFTVDDLMFLHRGGRVSRTSAVVGSLLGVKPMLHVGVEGQLLSHGKVRGRKQSLSSLVDEMKRDTLTGELDTVTISHGDCIDDVRIVESLVKENYSVKEFIINQLGATIGAHTGPGTIALFFEGKTRTE